MPTLSNPKERDLFFDEFILEKTKITKKTLSDVRKEKKDWFLSAQEAKKYGIIYEII